jgi:hypothetical protein
MSVWVRKRLIVSQYISLRTRLRIGDSFPFLQTNITARIIPITFPLCATQWSRIENWPVVYVPYFNTTF